jgi:hypothetical protein
LVTSVVVIFLSLALAGILAVLSDIADRAAELLEASCSEETE